MVRRQGGALMSPDPDDGWVDAVAVGLLAIIIVIAGFVAGFLLVSR